jgi:NAD(P)-dependent dehydrogenase (short-subunit alcohol dehydrogenase family)
LGAELASTVRVNAIAPTITETTLAANILRNDRMKENMVERHPMKSYLKPEEVADMAAFITEKPNQSQVKFLKWIMELSASKYN